jgi:hypothetical protein
MNIALANHIVALRLTIQFSALLQRGFPQYKWNFRAEHYTHSILRFRKQRHHSQVALSHECNRRLLQASQLRLKKPIN